MTHLTLLGTLAVTYAMLWHLTNCFDYFYIINLLLFHKFTVQAKNEYFLMERVSNVS